MFQAVVDGTMEASSTHLNRQGGVICCVVRSGNASQGESQPTSEWSCSRIARSHEDRGEWERFARAHGRAPRGERRRHVGGQERREDTACPMRTQQAGTGRRGGWGESDRS